jgi:hypothetical protein
MNKRAVRVKDALDIVGNMVFETEAKHGLSETSRVGYVKRSVLWVQCKIVVALSTLYLTTMMCGFLMDSGGVPVVVAFPNEAERTAAWKRGFDLAVSKLAKFGINWTKGAPGITESALKKACEAKVAAGERSAPCGGLGSGAPLSPETTPDGEGCAVGSDACQDCNDGDDVVSVASDDSMFLDEVGEIGTDLAVVGSEIADSEVIASFHVDDFAPSTPGSRQVSLEDFGSAVMSLPIESREKAIRLVANTLGLRTASLNTDGLPATTPSASTEGETEGGRAKPLYIKVPVAGSASEFAEMYVGTLIALWNTDPTASSDRIKRIKDAAAGFLSDKDLICNDGCIAVGVDCAWQFEEGVEFGHVILIGTKKGANSVVPNRTPVSLKDSVDANVVAACQYYVPVEADEVASLRAEHDIASGRLFRFGPSRWSTVTCATLLSIILIDRLIIICIHFAQTLLHMSFNVFV